ncbi:MAG: dTMP kinase [Thaumarchaeota archaeon]|nr:dTMP kinase [Nitrososphaerota archaeon]MCL5317601.1 dTMP kinase [Nitrososphaerota archaeon]
MVNSRPGLIIVLEGIDQSGKQTQSRMLFEQLKKQGIPAEYISFPDYTTTIGKEIEAFLAGKRSYYNLQARHMLLSLNRWERKDDLDRWLKEGRVVVLNRYSGSNYAYGVAQGLSLDWLMNLEKGLPEPGLTVLLDVPIAASLERKTAERDVHERDQDLLRRVREEYLKLAARWGWRVINGARGTDLVQRDVWRTVEEKLQLRSGSGIKGKRV